MTVRVTDVRESVMARNDAIAATVRFAFLRREVFRMSATPAALRG